MCWETLWATRCRTPTSSCSLTANSSTAMSTCPSPSMAPRPPPPPLHRPPLPPPSRRCRRPPPHSRATSRTTTARIAWSSPAIPPPSPSAKARFRGWGPWRCPWGGGRGWGWEGRAGVRRSCVWCAGIKRPGITTTRSPARDAKVFPMSQPLSLCSERAFVCWFDPVIILRPSPLACSRFLQAECDQEGCVSV